MSDAERLHRHLIGQQGSRRSLNTPALVLDLEGVDFVDSQGAAKMGDVIDLAEESGITLRLARLKPGVRATLQRDGIVDRLGENHVHGNVYRAVQAQLEASSTSSEGPTP